MNLTYQTLWAELKLRILESAMMLQDDYSNDDVIAKLLEAVDILDNTIPVGGDQIGTQDINSTRGC